MIPIPSKPFYVIGNDVYYIDRKVAELRCPPQIRDEIAMLLEFYVNANHDELQILQDRADAADSDAALHTQLAIERSSQIDEYVRTFNMLRSRVNNIKQDITSIINMLPPEK